LAISYDARNQSAFIVPACVLKVIGLNHVTLQAKVLLLQVVTNNAYGLGFENVKACCIILSRKRVLRVVIPSQKTRFISAELAVLNKIQTSMYYFQHEVSPNMTVNRTSK
jgi:hypothetical protein